MFPSHRVPSLEELVPKRYATYKSIRKVVEGREDEAKREQEIQGGEWTRRMKLKKKKN